MTAAALLWLDECARHGTTAHDAKGFFLADKDESPLHRHLNVIVPVSFACVGDAVTAAAYPTVRSDVLPFFEKYRSPDALFSADALTSMDTALRPFLSSRGYAQTKFPLRYGISLAANRHSVLPTDAVLDGTQALTERLSGVKNHTTMKPSDCAARGAFAHLVNGEIVCIASVNCVSGGARCVEIGVECAPQYRRHGFARSCVCALTARLISRGHTVLYRHYSTNSASGALALSAGFCPVGRFYAYTSFAI